MKPEVIEDNMLRKIIDELQEDIPLGFPDAVIIDRVQRIERGEIIDPRCP